jgi:hypothetical protein
MSERLSVRVTPEEKNMAEKLANYLHTKGKIQEDSVSEAVRLAIRFTTQEVLKTIEAERLGIAQRRP